jgi:hypothetical protein
VQNLFMNSRYQLPSTRKVNHILRSRELKRDEIGGTCALAAWSTLREVHIKSPISLQK